MAIQIKTLSLTAERLDAIKTRYKKVNASILERADCLIVSGLTEQIIVIANDEKLEWMDDLND